MKRKLFVLLSAILFISCEKEGELTKTGVDNVLIDNQSVLKYSGIFNPTSGINVNGNSKVYLDGNQLKLQLDAFSVTDGPDLKVYLSKTDSPDEFVNLGDLVIGSNLTYIIPASVDLQEYKYVLIHCQQYNHLFAVSLLNMVN